MKPLNSIIVDLAARRPSARKATANLQEITGFGSNPGNLRAWTYIPEALPTEAPLVVVLHGCTQNAADYDLGAGWSELADEWGFALLLPEQQRANNPNLCFNWFSPIDSRRDSGEALSIRQMIAWLVETQQLDQHRVFVTGLSAGGAMTSIMLATYPEVFAGGAIIAGLPFGAADSVSDAFGRMSGHGYPADTELASLVRAASPHDGPWPSISVWHGSADNTVSPGNADRIMAQWRPLHQVAAEPSEQEQVGNHTRRIWRSEAGQGVLEQHILTGLGHGTPLKTQGADAGGKAGPYLLEAGISSTRAIAQFWGLEQRPATTAAKIAPIPHLEPAAIAPLATSAFRRVPTSHPRKGVGAVIEDALRAAGLMK